MSPRLAMVGAIASGVTAWLLIGGPVGVAIGIITAPVIARLLRRLEPRSVRIARQAAADALPFSADLLAAALRAGVPMESAARTTGSACGGAVGRELVRVADSLRLGLDPADAWPLLGATPGGERIADAVVRSADSGAAIARALERVAEDMRAARASRVEATAQRVGVLIVLPLGLCFLPAFVLAGIVPVIVAVLGGVLR
jgi:pilus assembly protein TadC